MTPATSPSLLEHIDPSAAAIIGLPMRVAGTIATADGRFITGGMIDVTRDGRGWRARIRHMDRPGMVATMYFGGGVRDVIVRLDDGRRGRARITGTSFIAASQRVCDLVSDEPLL